MTDQRGRTSREGSKGVRTEKRSKSRVLFLMEGSHRKGPVGPISTGVEVDER